jgi:methylphosphotriester-DNA--protein-cysteine methyltransferase
MHAWEAIQNSLNYIEDHLSENIKIETLANVAALSPYYFQRLFGRLVKKSANEYVRLPILISMITRILPGEPTKELWIMRRTMACCSQAVLSCATIILI